MKRYRFPESVVARAAEGLGLGRLAVSRPGASGEKLGEGIARYLPAGVSLKDLPPSLSLAGEPKVLGKAEGGVAPSFAKLANGVWAASVTTNPGTDLYGTGEIAGPLRRNGKETVCWNSDLPGYTDADEALYQSHPWVLAVRPDGSAFGVLADTTWRCEIDLTDGIAFRAHGGPFAVYVIDRESPEAVMRGLAELIGTMPMPPRWALGYHQCRYSYNPDARVLEVAKTFRERSIPCDVIWLDIHYMDQYRVFTFDPVQFADPSALNSTLHDLGFNTVWMIDPAPAAADDYFVYEQGTELDAWVRTWDGHVFHGSVWPPDVVFPDFTRTDVCEWWAGLYKDFMATGIDGVWNDMNEPALVINGTEGNNTLPLDTVHKGGADGMGEGPHAQYHNVYGLLMVRATREGIAKANPEKRPFVLTRANFIGGQRYAATWTGDNTATWNDVHWSITMVLNLGLSGQPLVGPDIGGFIGAGTPEMMARWWGFGALLPFSRAHAACDNINKEPWCFGDETEATIRRSLERRYRLLPYIYTLARESHETGLPMARPVFFADPRDLDIRSEDHAFLLGRDLLVVAKATEAGDHAHKLPKGIWRDFEPLEGDVSDAVLPTLRVRGGSIVPMGPVIQHTGEQTFADPLTLVVCPDEDGRASGRLYEDDGDGHGHERGAFRDIRIEASTVGDRVVVELTKAGGDWPLEPRNVVVAVVTDAGVVRSSGLSTEPIGVPVQV